MNLGDGLQRSAPFASDRHDRVDERHEQGQDGEVDPSEGSLDSHHLMGWRHGVQSLTPAGFCQHASRRFTSARTVQALVEMNPDFAPIRVCQAVQGTADWAMAWSKMLAT